MISVWRLPDGVMMLVGAVILVLWVISIAWITSFKENIVLFTVILLATAAAAFIPAARWRYQNFYRHMNHHLG